MKNLNDKMLFWASFLTLIAAGMGFSIRGDILADWGGQFGFTQTELGEITGMGLVGFGITIIFFSFFADVVGYGKLMVVAFVLHVLSVGMTLMAPQVFEWSGKMGAFWCLYLAQLAFSLANGTCEAVINPLTATLFPKNKTHWLNILHAGWPGGLVLGALVGLGLDRFGMGWQIKWAIVLAPMLLYGVMMVGRPFPRSEASEAGIPLGTMFAALGSVILLFLFLLHALIGYVELGTDSWIINITNTVLKDKATAQLAFIWTNVLMFTLRFFAGPIVHKISPLGLLFASAVLGTLGLWLLGTPWTDSAWPWLAAVTVYGIGKTFYWPTMLGVVSERFPKSGALGLGICGGIGVISAGLLGTRGIGYEQDYFASTQLERNAPVAYQRYKSDDVNRFLFFPAIAGLDGSKVAILASDGAQLKADMARLEKDGKKMSREQVQELLAQVQKDRASGKTPELKAHEVVNVLYYWWEDQAKLHAAEDQAPVKEATLFGGKMALTYTAAVPAVMALGFLLLIIYFRLRGGYKAEVLVGHQAEDEKFTGGVEGPAEM